MKRRIVARMVLELNDHTVSITRKQITYSDNVSTDERKIVDPEETQVKMIEKINNVEQIKDNWTNVPSSFESSRNILIAQLYCVFFHLIESSQYIVFL